MKTKEEIIDEMVKTISEKGRCVCEAGFCYYWHSSLNTGCAVGIFLKDEYKTDYFASLNKCTSGALFTKYGFEILKDEYRVESMEFWRDMQGIHDCSDYWNPDNTLNKCGRKRVNEMKEKFCGK